MSTSAPLPEYKPGAAPLHLATRAQLAVKKLVPTADPVGYIILRKGPAALYDWRDTKHSRSAGAK